VPVGACVDRRYQQANIKTNSPFRQPKNQKHTRQHIHKITVLLLYFDFLCKLKNFSHGSETLGGT
jgi:hypothetical protein